MKVEDFKFEVKNNIKIALSKYKENILNLLNKNFKGFNIVSYFYCRDFSNLDKVKRDDRLKIYRGFLFSPDEGGGKIHFLFKSEDKDKELLKSLLGIKNKDFIDILRKSYYKNKEYENNKDFNFNIGKFSIKVSIVTKLFFIGDDENIKRDLVVNKYIKIEKVSDNIDAETI